MRPIRWTHWALVAGTLTLGCSDGKTAEPFASERLGLTVSGQQKLQAADGAAHDAFGNAVSLSGTHAFVAAPQDDSNGLVDQGAVYVFGRTGSSLSQRQKLVASDGLANERFGHSLASDDTTLLVGMPNDKVGALDNCGSVRVFSLVGGNFVEQQPLVGSASVEARIGSSVALAGDTAFASQATAIEVYSRGDGSFQFTQLIQPGGGRRIAAMLVASGDTLIAGYGCDPFDVSACRGAAYVYVRSAGVWVQQQKLVPPVREANDFFGASVALSENTALVGAPGSTVSGATLRGAAYAFVRTGSTWSMQRTFTAADGRAEDRFGSEVALRNDIAFVGAPFHEHNGINANHGSAYVSIRTGTVWSEPLEVRASDGQNNDFFGEAVALSNGVMLVGSPNDDGPNPAQGSAYLFQTMGANGERCSTGSECASGFCSDGRCCNTACVGACDACSVAASATRDGECTFVGGSTPAASACAPLTCNGTSASCATCASDVDCASDKYCDASGVCQPRKAVGRACEASAGADCKTTGCRVCASGNCVDGFCCNDACAGGCRSCNGAVTGAANGSCAPVRAGTDPKNACVRDPRFPDSCGADGECNGAGQCRTVALEDTACGDLTCSGGTVRDFACNATGQCVANTTQCDGGTGGSGGSTGTGGSGTGGAGTGGAGGSGNGGTAGASGSGNGGTGGTGGDPEACVRVAPDGNDAAALATNGATPFATLQPAIDFAAANPSIASRVCVAGGPSCTTSALYSSEAGSDLTMRNRVSVVGGFESTGWSRCAGSNTDIATTSPAGIVFGSEIVDGSTLDGFHVFVLPAEEPRGITVDGARGVELTGLFVSPQDPTVPALRFAGIDVRNSAEVTIVESDVESPVCLLEGVGIRSTQSRISFSDGAVAMKGVEEADDAIGPFTLRAVELRDSPASRVEGSHLSIVAPREVSQGVEGIVASGDAQDTIIDDNAVVQPDGSGISFSDCNGSTFIVMRNTVAPSDPSELVGAGIGIATGAGCAAIIDGNVVRATGSVDSTTIGIFSRDGSTVRNNDVSTRNVARGLAALGSSHQGYGIVCEDCREVSRNRVVGLESIGCFRNCDSGSIGLLLSGNAGTLVDSNRVTAGCSGGPTGGPGSIGINAAGTLRIQNNIVIAGVDCSSAPDQAVALTYGIRVIEGDVDIHSNRIDAGVTRSAVCTSAGIYLLGPGARIRNNVLDPGNCSLSSAVDEGRGGTSPSHLENNAFVPVAGVPLLYRDIGTVDPRTIEAVNALSDMVSRNNFAADCPFPLTSPSACIDAGTTEGAPAHDIDGDPRGANPPDVGPDELL